MIGTSKAIRAVLLACLSAVFVATSHAQDAVGVEKLTGTLPETSAVSAAVDRVLSERSG